MIVCPASRLVALPAGLSLEKRGRDCRSPMARRCTPSSSAPTSRAARLWSFLALSGGVGLAAVEIGALMGAKSDRLRFFG